MMIIRLWRGATTPENAAPYLTHLETSVFPELRAIEGNRGARVLRRQTEMLVDFLVLTIWDSVDVIARFAGDDIERAVVPPEARALLTTFDDVVAHYEVVSAFD